MNHSSQRFPLPGLSALLLGGFKGDFVYDKNGEKVLRRENGPLNKPIHKLEECLKYRSTHGARLKKLELKNCKGVGKVDLEDFKRWVDEVEMSHCKRLSVEFHEKSVRDNEDEYDSESESEIEMLKNTTDLDDDSEADSEVDSADSDADSEE
ncbi:hypothetical protein BD410DRAFT_788438 [Rickenella mellea]|uniref:Uncharacterized protein n=1 Tax=Rickenella mellea TaxID=50990 RepID=A0A4Y7Q4V6_9AGAM|nr:hypothetical protein BD410DRAFT_788438 [Rickenella mellea]